MMEICDRVFLVVEEIWVLEEEVKKSLARQSSTLLNIRCFRLLYDISYVHSTTCFAVCDLDFALNTRIPD